jgi:hypothetical protein
MSAGRNRVKSLNRPPTMVHASEKTDNCPAERKDPRGSASVVRRAVDEIWNQGNLDVADALFAESYTNEGGLVPNIVLGPEAIKVAAALHHTAFPKLHVIIDRLISAGSLVAFPWLARSRADDAEVVTESGTPIGTLRGRTFCRLDSGQIVQSWTNWDSGSALRKILWVTGGGPGHTPLATNLN